MVLVCEEENPTSMDPAVEFIPRNYQQTLIKVSLKQNSIIYLPTGSGKTFIAVCVLREMAQEAFEKTYNDGGKISVMLVNTVALVQQHSTYLRKLLPYKVGSYIGDMNVDFWDKQRWIQEFNDNQILIMTSQIFANILAANIADLNKVNLLIFDECHQAVEAHAMRQIMMKFQDVQDPPRVIGLSATLLNGNVKNVYEHVKKLETTYHAQVATVDELEHVLGYSTNPREYVEQYSNSDLTETQQMICDEFERLIEILKVLKAPNLEDQKLGSLKLPLLNKEKGYQKLYKLCMDAIIHVKTLGVCGARIAMICYIIHLECEKKLCEDKQSNLILNSVVSKFIYAKALLEREMSSTRPEIRLMKYMSMKVLKLLQILEYYPKLCPEELCCIIFVQRKNTALILYHILNEITKQVTQLKHIKPDFIIGFNANPLNSTREGLYYSKMNKRIVDKFKSKEINVIIASNVIEEGIDVPKCSLVIKFDTPTNYREYIQSKGRARHKGSLYYIMVDSTDYPKFVKQFNQYQQTESELQGLLVGRNELRNAPSESDIDALYKEVPPYYTNGPNSAHVTMLSAVQLLMLYCGSLQADAYTRYEPIWYLQKIGDGLTVTYRVYVELPVVCPLVEPIAGVPYSNKRDAKRSAAFLACILLHKCGELDDNLIPVVRKSDEPANEHLFKHWPEVKEKFAGLKKTKRIYQKMVPKVIEKPLDVQNPLYFHIINVNPKFEADVTEMENYKMHKMYSHKLCFGFLTASPLPNLCQFSCYVTPGELLIDVSVNKQSVTLTEEQLHSIRNFHHLVFSEVMGIMKHKYFLTLGNNSVKHMFIVPVDKETGTIDFETIQTHKSIVDQYTPPTPTSNLVVDEEGYLEKIVTPWYRAEDKQYIVLRVCDDRTAASPFPNSHYQSYAAYFRDKYSVNTINEEQPLILVKALSSRLNCIKPRGASKKKSKDETFENLSIHLIPEMCIKQDFPASLWIQAKLLPTVLHKIVHLLQAEQLRSTIASEAEIGVVNGNNWKPLELDVHLQEDKSVPKNSKDTIKNTDPPKEISQKELGSILTGSNAVNKEFKEIINDSEYPWSLEEEPTDVYRNLGSTRLDIEYFVKFVHEPIREIDDISVPTTTQWPAINYNPQFEHKQIELLSPKYNNKGPELRSIYEALMTAKCNDIVNLERLETLGDSYLKLLVSLYIFIKFPKYSEGQATDLKGKIISNKNLYYLAKTKNIGGLLKSSDLVPETEWLPPGYCVPELVCKHVNNKNIDISCLFHIDMSDDERVSGRLQPQTENHIETIFSESAEKDENEDPTLFSSMCNYLGKQMVPDKTMADVTEALIGAYFESQGFNGAIKFIEWLGIIPKAENMLELLKDPSPSPIINPNAKLENVNYLMPNWWALQVENIIDYNFKNKAYLLQALTHTSYTKNRITHSFQRLEFLGDAVLDFLITTHIYESCGKLDPGELTDLRSALVNNEIFAAYVVKLGLYKYLKHYNSTLERQITKFVTYQEKKDFAIDDDVLILINEDNLRIAEAFDVPKILGDLFESIAGAIYLDSGKNLNVVWKVYYKIMHREIQKFSHNVPKNSIRMLLETLAPLHPKFGDAIEVKDSNTIMITVDFMLNGTMTRVYGFGENKKCAKKAASKIALRLLSATQNKVK